MSWGPGAVRPFVIGVSDSAQLPIVAQTARTTIEQPGDEQLQGLPPGTGPLFVLSAPTGVGALVRATNLAL
jgi:hypothetical protein